MVDLPTVDAQETQRGASRRRLAATVRDDAAFTLLLFAVPAALALLAYWPYLGDAFAWDDWLWLSAVQHHSLLEVAGRGFQFREWSEFDAATPFFRPATDIGVKLELLAFGEHPLPYHVVNLVLHLAVCGCGALIVARLTGSRIAALAVGSIFAIYPAQDIAVSWISQLAELLGAAGAVFALASFQRYATAPERAAPRWLVACFAAMTIAVLAKESQTSTVVLFPALAWLTPGRARTRRELTVAIAGLALVFGGYALFHAVHQWVDPQSDFYKLGRHIPGHVIEYVQWLAFPFSPDAGWADGIRTAGAALFFGSGVFALATGRRVPAFFFLWTLLWVLPFSLFVGNIQHRYAYIASLPFIAFAVTGIREVAQAYPIGRRQLARAAGIAAIVLVLIPCARGIHVRQRYLHQQAVLTDEMVTRVRAECAGTPAGGSVAIVGYPLLDPFSVTIPAAVQFMLGPVHVRTAASADGVVADCVVRNPG